MVSTYQKEQGAHGQGHFSIRKIVEHTKYLMREPMH